MGTSSYIDDINATSTSTNQVAIAELETNDSLKALGQKALTDLSSVITAAAATYASNLKYFINYTPGVESPLL